MNSLSSNLSYLGCQLLKIPHIKKVVFTPFDPEVQEESINDRLDDDSLALYEAAAPKIEATLLTLLLKYFEKNQNFSMYLNNDQFFIEELVRFLTAKITVNLAKMTSEEGKVSLLEIIENALSIMQSQIGKHHVAIKGIYELAELKKNIEGEDRLAVEKERDLLLKKELQSAANTLLFLMFPSGAEELPLRFVIRDLVFIFVKDLVADLTVQLCHATYYSESKKDFEALAKRFGKIEPVEDLSDVEKEALALKNLKIEIKVKQYRQLGRTLAADALKKYFQPDELEKFGFSGPLVPFLAPVCANGALQDYLQKLLSDLLFKVMAHQAMRLAPDDEFPLASLIKDIAEQADTHLGGLDPRHMKELYETDGNVREPLIPFAQVLLPSLSADPSNELLCHVLASYRGMVYSRLETQILPDLISKYYRSTHIMPFGLETAKLELNTLFAKKVKADCNYVNSFCAYLAKWGAQFLSNQMYLKNTEIAAKLNAFIPAKYFEQLKLDPLRVLERNIRSLADEVPKLKMVESHVHAAIFTRVTSAVKNIGRVEDEALFTKFIGRTLELINCHLEAVHAARTDPQRVGRWGFRKSLKECFSDMGRLHPALQGGDKREAYFRQLSARLLRFVDLNDPALLSLTPEQFAKLKFEILPEILKELIANLTTPEVIDKIAYVFFTMESTFTKDLEKAEFTQALEDIETIIQKITSFLAAVEKNPADVKWLEEKGGLTQKIVEVQRRLYYFQNIDERKKLLDDLNAIKNDIIPLMPQKEPILVETIRNRVRGSADSKGLEATLKEAKETYDSSAVKEKDRIDPFNAACGRLVLNFINLLPHNNLTKQVYSLKNIQDVISVTLGKAVRKQADEGSFLKNINKGAEKGVPAMVDVEGYWFGTNGETEFLTGTKVAVAATDVEHGNPFFTFENGVHYRFDPSDEQPFHFSKTVLTPSEKLAAYQKLKKDLNGVILVAADDAIRQGIAGFFQDQIEALRDRKNLFVAEVQSVQKEYSSLETQSVMIKTCLFATSLILRLDEYGRAIAKTYNDESTLLRKFCDLVEKVLVFLLHPVVEILFGLINLYVKELERESMKMAHMEIHQNVVFEILDEFFAELGYNLPHDGNLEI